MYQELREMIGKIVIRIIIILFVFFLGYTFGTKSIEEKYNVQADKLERIKNILEE